MRTRIKAAAGLSWLLFSLSSTTAQAEGWLAERLREASRGGHYVAAGSAELAGAERLFAALAAGGQARELAPAARELDMEIEESQGVLIVRERDGARRGRGFYAFRRGASGDALHVPHAFKDEMTREIGLALFAEGRFAAAAWNTVPRRYEWEGKAIDADLAHLPATWFTAFARSAARAWPRGRSLQIHGFEAGKRRSAASASAEAILSDGSHAPASSLMKQRDCLAGQLGRRIALYPHDVRELGGTTNAQGHALRALGYGGFVHLEMSHALRQALRDDKSQRARLLGCWQP